MPNLFAQAARAAAPPRSKAAKPETVWTVADGKLSDAISTVRRLTGEAKTLNGKLEEAKGLLKSAGQSMLAADIARLGELPETPMRLRNGKGETVTFVMTDKTGSFDVPDETLAHLAEVVGSAVAGDLVEEAITYQFNPAVLVQPTADGAELWGRPMTVAEAIVKTIGPAVDRMVKAGKITPEQAASLIVAERTRRFKPGLLEQVGTLCQRKVERIAGFFAAIGTAVSRSLLAS